eukprot:scaffold4511_cov171-Amphora_coffeaeformis.AAC.6
MDRYQQEIVELTQTNNDLWRKVSLLLVAEATQAPLSAEFPAPCEILHAAINIVDCPASFQEQAILLYSELLKQPMTHNDSVPLHVAAERGNTALLLDLIQACLVAAAIRNFAGELPLHTALQHQPLWRWKDGVGALVEAHPAALEELQLPDNVYPNIWSQLSSRESLFYAIRSFPRPFGDC